MWRPGVLRPVRPPRPERQERSSFGRDRLAAVVAFVTMVCLGLIFMLSKGTAFLMPGPLTSAHGAIENCVTCHTKSGSGKLSWVHGLLAGDPRADSKACITCHKMPETAFNAHSASVDVLKRSTERLAKAAAAIPRSKSDDALNFAFPAHDVAAQDLTCATCHQEHQGTNFKLNKLSNEQCRSCHVVKFDSFDSDHPKFENYPFKRRTRVVYDHAAHFGRHYPEVAKKDPAKVIPDTCSTCHNSRDDKYVMAVAPFEKTCASCHLDQITGKERASGPKGIAFLALPGIDVQSLKTKNAAIGEWPDASDAALTPFMKVMISRNEEGRALIKVVDGLNLQDLGKASDDQIKAVTDLVWQIKRLFHALIAGKASDVLGDLNIESGAKLSASLVADLTASIPRDVVVSAQQQWLPNLAAEIANGPSASDQKQDGSSTVPTDPVVTGAASPEPAPNPDTQVENGEPDAEDAEREAASKVKRDPPACSLRLFGQCLVSKDAQEKSGTTKPEGAAAKSKTANTKTANTKAANTKADDGNKSGSTKEWPGRMNAGAKDAGPAAEPAATAVNQPQGTGANQSDDLLFPTEEEQRELSAHNKNSGKAAQTNEVTAGAAVPSDSALTIPQTKPAPVISIESSVDSESWAEYGGWYRQDYEIFYRPTGHKDKFIYSWLFLTGPQAPKDDTSPAAAVFDFLTSKDAQGSCTKCHSVDGLKGRGRVVNFSPTSVEAKKGRFTRFIHEPHFGVIGDRGCLTCHSLGENQAREAAATAMPGRAASANAVSTADATAQAEANADLGAVAGTDAAKGVSPYLKSYEQSNPHAFAPEFNAVKKDLCHTCHTSSMARQDCLTCHKYHVNDVVTPITATKNPIQ